jgi:hypothetical protein
LPILAERGYLIPAVNTAEVDYVACANQLADSILKWHPDANITILTKDMLPYGDLGGYANDWQVFYVSPYRQTIKLEADMHAASPVDHWWTMFEHRDVVVSQGARDFYDRPADSRYYRKIFDNNNLPDVYNAITYWRVSQTAKEFFGLVKNIFENWAEYRKMLKMPDEQASTDVVYAMAAVIMGVDKVTLPAGLGPTIVHMKKHIINTVTDNWTDELVWEHTSPGLRVNTIAQWGLFHYHIKDWIHNEQR